VDAVTHTVFVANSGDNTVSVIDESTNSVTAGIGIAWDRQAWRSIRHQHH
jgi:YVTN family beta-propeller protein